MAESTATHGTSVAALTFTFTDAQNLRVILFHNEPWFVASDVADILEYRDASNIARMCEDDERGTHNVSTPSGEQKMAVISEPGLYRVLSNSRSARAKPFQRKLFHEILPAIRKTGRYAAPIAPAPACAAEAITHNDMQNIKRLIWLAVHGFRYQGSWTQAVWFDLRKVLAWPSPAPFTVDQIPTIAVELQRIYGAADQVQSLIADIEQQAAKRIFRKGEAADVVVADLKRLADARMAEVSTELQTLPIWLQRDLQAITQRSPAAPCAYLDNEKPGYFGASS